MAWRWSAILRESRHRASPAFAMDLATETAFELPPLGAIVRSQQRYRLALAAHPARPPNPVGEQLRRFG